MYKTLEGDRCVGPGFASISITVIKDKRRETTGEDSKYSWSGRSASLVGRGGLVRTGDKNIYDS